MDKAYNWKQFFALTGILDETFDKESSKIRVDIYFEALKDFSIKQVEEAIKQAIKTKKFYPKPAELIELVTGSLEDRAEIAWMEVLKNTDSGASVLFDDPIIPKVIIHLSQSWPDFCENLYVDKLPFIAKDFKAAYRALARSGQNLEPVKLIGFHECHNSEKGLNEFIPQIRQIKTGYKGLPSPKEMNLIEDKKPQ